MMDAGTATLSNFPTQFAFPTQSAFPPLFSTSSAPSHFNSLSGERQQVWDNSPIEGSEIDNKAEEMPTNSLPLPLNTHPTNLEHNVSEESFVDLTLPSTVGPEENVLSSGDNDAKEITNHSQYESFSASTTPIQTFVRTEVLPPIMLEFNSDFYCLFSKPPLMDIDDDDISFLNSQVLFYGKLTFFAAKIKELFGIINDIVIEFPDLRLSFYEYATHTQLYSLHHLHLLHTAFLRHSQKPVQPLRMLLLECPTSFQSQIQFLTSLLPQSQGFPEIAVVDVIDKVSDKFQDEEVIISDVDQEVYYDSEEDHIEYVEELVHEEEHENEQQYHESTISDTEEYSEQYGGSQEYDYFQSSPQEIVDQGMIEVGEEVYPVDGQSEAYEDVSDTQFQSQDRTESGDTNIHASSVEFYSGFISQEPSNSELQVDESRDDRESGSGDLGKLQKGEDGSSDLQHDQARIIQQDFFLTGTDSVEAAGFEAIEHGQLSEEFESVKTMKIGMAEPEILRNPVGQDEIQLAEEDEVLLPFDEETDQLDPFKNGDSSVQIGIEDSDEDALRREFEQNESLLLKLISEDDDVNVVESEGQETDVIQDDLNFVNSSGEFTARDEDVNGKRKWEASEDNDEDVKKVKV